MPPQGQHPAESLSIHAHTCLARPTSGEAVWRIRCRQRYFVRHHARRNTWLAGPNGAGKTTTIHMLLGVVTPTAGSIQMFGLDLTTHREEILQQVNFSSTYVSLPQALTVEDNLWVIARLYGLTQIQNRVNDIVKRLEMEEFRQKVTRKLSSGQSTLLGLAERFSDRTEDSVLDQPMASLY